MLNGRGHAAHWGCKLKMLPFWWVGATNSRETCVVCPSGINGNFRSPPTVALGRHLQYAGRRTIIAACPMDARANTSARSLLFDACQRAREADAKDRCKSCGTDLSEDADIAGSVQHRSAKETKFVSPAPSILGDEHLMTSRHFLPCERVRGTRRNLTLEFGIYTEAHAVISSSRSPRSSSARIAAAFATNSFSA